MPRRSRTFGTVRQLPSGRWQARYLDANGVRHAASTTFLTKADANAYLARVETDMSRGAWIDPRLSGTTFERWAASWWELTEPTLRLKTRASYRWVLDRYLIPTFGNEKLVVIDTLAVRRWLADLHRQDAGDATIAKAYRVLRRVLGAAVEAGYLLRNPCTIKGAGSETTPDLHVPTLDEITKLTEVFDARYRAMVLTAAYGALRWGELVGLRRYRVDTHQAVIYVAEQVIEHKGKHHPGPPKSEAGLRAVQLPRFVADELAEHLQRYAEPGRTGLVFPAPRGGYLRSSNFNRNFWKPALARAGLSGVRFHDLRHAGATMAAQTGATTKELMARIGHASPAAALRYQHAQAERDKAIAEGLERLARKGTHRARTRPARRSKGVRKWRKDAP